MKRGIALLTLGAAALFYVSVDRCGWHSALIGWAATAGIAALALGTVSILAAVGL